MRWDDLSALHALLDAAARARKTAQEALDFFRHAVFEHHAEEEEQLFPAVASSAVAGDERQRVEAPGARAESATQSGIGFLAPDFEYFEPRTCLQVRCGVGFGCT